MIYSFHEALYRCLHGFDHRADEGDGVDAFKTALACASKSSGEVRKGFAAGRRLFREESSGPVLERRRGTA